MPDMKAALIAAGLALLTLATPAYASWAENANSTRPVFTGTSASLARAQADTGYRYRRGYSVRRIRHHAPRYR
jgi:hypothetical protein